MKILYYNWVPLGDPLKRGGGVRIYQESLVRLALEQGHDVTYFSSGIRYSTLRRKTHISRSKAIDWQPVRAFEIINSPVMAPSHHNFGRQIDDSEEKTYIEFLINFINSEGPFDVLHLNNVEGLPLRLFENRHRLNIKTIIFSLHNYQPLCQQVNLWHDERVSCSNYQNGRRCTYCVKAPPSWEIKAASRFHDFLEIFATEGSATHKAAFDVYHLIKRPARLIIRPVRGLRRLLVRFKRPQELNKKKIRSDGDLFREHRQLGVRFMNEWVDHNLAVSQRVKQIYEFYGVHPHRIQTHYIATKFSNALDIEAAKCRLEKRLLDWDRHLHIAYFGYMRKDKGFFFLMEAIKAMPVDAQRKVRVTIAASDVSSAKEYLERHLGNVADWVAVDGYTHAELPDLLADVDLGIIPVLWEDNLPQVAFEFVCNGVPIMTSDRGGAQELVGQQSLVFRSGDKQHFGRVLSAIAHDPKVLRDFWDNERLPIYSWSQHWSALETIYLKPPQISRNVGVYSSTLSIGKR